MANTPNLALVVWRNLMDRFNHVDLADNWDKVDAHNHTGSGRGIPIPAGGLAPASVQNSNLQDYSLSTAKYQDRSVTEPKIGLGAVQTGQIQDGAVTLPKIDAAVGTALADAVQEGVVNSGDGVVTRPLATTLRVSAGTAWINGDGVNGLNGRYRVTWPQTDITVSAAGGGMFRAYRVVVPIPAAGYGTATPVARAGTDDAGANLDTLTGLPPLAAGELQLAVAIADSGGVDPNGLRDRRRFATGFKYRYHRTANTSTATTSTTPVSLWAGNGDFRIEGNGVNVVEVGLDGHVTSPTGGGVVYTIYLYAGTFGAGGVELKHWSFRDNFDADVALRVPIVAFSGSTLYKWYHSTSVFGASGKINIDGPNNVIADVWVKEYIGGLASNGTL